MALADRLIKKVDKILSKFNLTDGRGDVYKRVITRTGGDSLIGKPSTVVKTDTLLSPPPAVQVIDLSIVNVKRGYNPNVIVGGVVVAAGDYIVRLSPTAVTEEELTNPDFCLVFGTEERSVVSFDRTVVNGKTVLFNVDARKKA